MLLGWGGVASAVKLVRVQQVQGNLEVWRLKVFVNQGADHNAVLRAANQKKKVHGNYSHLPPALPVLNPFKVIAHPVELGEARKIKQLFAEVWRVARRVGGISLRRAGRDAHCNLSIFAVLVGECF